MTREQLTLLHYITHAANVRSILERGILSYNRASVISHESIAMAEVQELRTWKATPGKRRLHSYANLYFNARNPMLLKRRDMRGSCCVLRVDSAVLDLPGVYVTNGNAASRETVFELAAEGLRIVDYALTYAHSWYDNDAEVCASRKRAVCAEVLVPDKIPPEHIIDAVVCSQDASARLRSLAPRLQVVVDPNLFFDDWYGSL